MRPRLYVARGSSIHHEDDTEQGCLGTDMHAVHAIAPVCAAPPGYYYLPRSAHHRPPGVLSKGFA
jgi:hypothetical protein